MGTNFNFQLKTHFTGLGLCLAMTFAALGQEPTPATTPAVSTAPVPPQISTPVPSLEKAAKGGKANQHLDSVYSALVLATNEESTAQTTPELVPLVPRLKSIFGYNRFELVGSHTELMDNPDEHWLVPSKSFSLSIKSKREKNASYLLNLQLFQETKMLASFDAKLGQESPILIRGPLCGKGQLVIVLIVR